MFYTGVSDRTIRRMRDPENETYSLNAVVAVCVALHLIDYQCDMINVPEAYIEKNGKPEISAWSWVIDVKTVVESGKCDGTKLFMLTELFPLAREYKAMREYTEELQKRMENQRKTTDWFDEL